jgi:hypothetical protein
MKTRKRISIKAQSGSGMKTPKMNRVKYETLLYDVGDAIATITLNRPDR